MGASCPTVAGVGSTTGTAGVSGSSGRGGTGTLGGSLAASGWTRTGAPQAGQNFALA